MFNTILTRLIKDEKGQSVILVAILAVLLLGITAFTVDAGYLYLQKRNLQNVADAAALAGAQELPGANQTEIEDEVESYITAHGLDPNNDTFDLQVTVSYEDLDVTVELSSEYGLFFARALNRQTASVYAMAKAGRTVEILSGSGLNWFEEFMLFSETSMSLTGPPNGQVINGLAHSNDYMRIQGGTGSGTLQVAGDNHHVTNSPNLVPVNEDTGHLPMPFITGFTGNIEESFNNDMVFLRGIADEVIESDKTFTDSDLIGEGLIIFVEGDAHFSGAQLSGVGMIVATGDISFSSAIVDVVGHDGNEFVALYAGGDIKLANAGQELTGIVFAPKGEVAFPSASLTLTGSVIADEIRIPGSGAVINPLTDTEGTSELLPWEEETIETVKLLK